MTNRRAPFNVAAGVLPGGATAGGVEWIIVANEAAASAEPALADGQPVFILSHRSLWMSAPNSTIALVAHEVINRAGGGRLVRDLTYSDPLWRMEITDVYVDPANSTGIASDENKGIFNSAQVGNARLPLHTLQELSRRFGRRNTITTGDLVNFTFQVHMISSDGGADFFDFDAILGTDTTPRILGEASTTVLGPIALTAFTAQNPAVPAPGGTPCSIQIGATVWAAFLGKRIRRVSDGSVATVLKDLGGGVARISQPQLTNEASFATSPTNVNWAAGNNVVVEDLTQLNVSHWAIGCEGSAFGFAGQINILDCNIVSAQGAGTTPFWFPLFDDGMVLVCYQSVFTSPFDFTSRLVANSCTARGGFYSDNAGSLGAFFGGAVYGPSAFVPFVNANDTGNSGVGCIDFFSYFQGCAVLFRHASTVGSFSVWDAPVAGTVNPGGHGIGIGGGPGGDAGFSAVAMRGTIFGSGQIGRGVRVASGSRVSAYGTLPNVTGAAGDFQLGDDTSAIPLYDTPSYVYTRVADAQVIAANTDVALQAATSGNLVVATPSIALVAGKTYRLRFEARGDTTTLGETLDFAWVDNGTNAELIANTGRGQISNVATNAAESYGVAEIIYKPAANQNVKVRCVAGVIGGTTTLRQITGRVSVESLFEFPIACTWANLALSVAAGGFGGSAHNPRQDAHINQAAAS